MKILLLGFSKIKYMPYANLYLDNIDRAKHEIHFLYWNRDCQNEDLSGLSGITLHEFKGFQEDDKAKIFKLANFKRYRQLAIRLIDRENYDFIIVLHSIPGVLLVNKLCRDFMGRYFFDYRDSTYERFRFYQKIIYKLVANSSATFVSSTAFKRFMPQSEMNKVYASHNLLIDSLKHQKDKALYGTRSDRIRISFWGLIRHEDINKVIISKIAADDRFELHYYGREQKIAENLKRFAQAQNARNVFFHGEYVPEERYSFALDTDLLHNLYDDANMRLAMGNKYYDGIIMRIPQLCLRDSYMGDCVTQADVGLACDPQEPCFLDSVYNYFFQIKEEQFGLNCEKALKQIIGEYERTISVIKKTIS